MCKITEKSFLAKNDYQQMQENNTIETWKFDNIDLFYCSVVLADRKTALWQFIDKTFMISNFFVFLTILKLFLVWLSQRHYTMHPPCTLTWKGGWVYCIPVPKSTCSTSVNEKETQNLMHVWYCCEARATMYLPKNVGNLVSAFE